jgi:hypothetical protein
MILADAGIPMFMIQAPAMALALIPVIVIEAVAARRVFGLTPRDAFAGTAIANTLSTIVGVPIACFALIFVAEATRGGTIVGYDSLWKRIIGTIISMAWLGPDEKNDYWMVPLAATAFLIPTFFLSVLIERWVLRFRWKAMEPQSVTRAAWLLNTMSYAFLFTLGLAWIAYALITHQKT